MGTTLGQRRGPTGGSGGEWGPWLGRAAPQLSWGPGRRLEKSEPLEGEQPLQRAVE